MKKPIEIPEPQMQAWVSLLHAHAQLLERLSNELDQAGEVSFGTYDVLVQLSQAGGKLRLKDLLGQLVLSQPGLSRRVERLEASGLVERRPDPSDGRGVVVVLTRAGRHALRSAAIVHMAGIDREFTGLLSVEEAEVLTRVFSRVLGQKPES